MAKERLSKLQKNILVIIYKKGKQKDMITEYAETKDKKRIVKLKKEGYKFGGKHNNPLTPKAELYFTKEITIYQLKRKALLFKLNDWQKYNIYVEGYYGFGWKGRPKDYSKKQVSLTRSLRNLCGKRLIDLYNLYEAISIYDKRLAKKLKIKPENFEKNREEALKKEKENYKEYKKTNTNPFIKTFEDWWTEPLVNSLSGGQTARKAIWESWNDRRVGRNTDRIQLTNKGIRTAAKLLLLNTKTANHN